MSELNSISSEYANGQIHLSYLVGPFGLHEKFVEFYQNGNKKVECMYDHGKLTGPKYRYHENGGIKSIEYIRQGKKHGQTIKFDEEGRMISFVEYENGEPGGMIIKFENGELKKIKCFKGGDCIYTIDSTHTHLSVQRYNQNILNGVCFVYNKFTGMECIIIH